LGDAFTLDAPSNNSLKEKTEISEDFLLAQHVINSQDQKRMLCNALFFFCVCAITLMSFLYSIAVCAKNILTN